MEHEDGEIRMGSEGDFLREERMKVQETVWRTDREKEGSVRAMAEEAGGTS